MKHPVTAVITYCSNDYPYIKKNIEEVSLFTRDILVIYSDYFFDGSKEDKNIIDRTIKENPQAKFIKMPYRKNRIPYFWDRYPLAARLIGQFFLYGSKYWADKSRWLGFNNLKADTEYILFLDSDEIINGTMFKKWLDTDIYKQYDGLKFATYWYFREPSLQATTIVDGPVMVHVKSVKNTGFWKRTERDGILDSVSGRVVKMVKGTDDMPMIHHYSWVKSKKEMLKKVQTWSHNHHCNWEKLVKEEFAHEFNGKDFIQGYTFKKVKPFFRPSRS